MEKIKKDFILGEFRRLALCAAGFAICLFILMRFSPQLAAYQPLPWLAVAAILVLAGLRSVMLARTGIGGLTDSDIYLLEKEYLADHPVYRVWQGEIHLLPSFIVCRNRGRLLFIPLHKIERVERRFDRIGMRKVPFAKFILDTSQSISIGFSPNHAKDSEAVYTWLAERIGKDKVGE
ncbi:MAG: hypothetical protein HFE44_03500 [Oscillospiraceae bacterium]|jgi:hypothetical protein|nr:hypothetical protein [Oscillospiraceae bacterium]